MSSENPTGDIDQATCDHGTMDKFLYDMSVIEFTRPMPHDQVIVYIKLFVAHQATTPLRVPTITNSSYIATIWNMEPDCMTAHVYAETTTW